MVIQFTSFLKLCNILLNFHFSEYNWYALRDFFSCKYFNFPDKQMKNYMWCSGTRLRRWRRMLLLAKMSEEDADQHKHLSGAQKQYAEQSIQTVAEQYNVFPSWYELERWINYLLTPTRVEQCSVCPYCYVTQETLLLNNGKYCLANMQI